MKLAVQPEDTAEMRFRNEAEFTDGETKIFFSEHVTFALCLASIIVRHIKNQIKGDHKAMKNRKTFALFSLLLSAGLIGSLLTGCRQEPVLSAEQAAVQTALPAAGPAVSETETTTTVRTEETAVQTEPAAESRITFQPKVCSEYMKEVFGEKMCEAWYSMVDAMMEGKDTFVCPDDDTFDWMIGQFPHRCFPVVEGLIGYPENPDHPVENGIAHFRYTVPREEFTAKVSQFAETVENILNETVKETDTDFEKALSLYQYFTDHYTYDYDLYEALYSDVLEQRETSACHVFDEKSGICCEISTAYSYLLMQTGVNATVMMGDDHQWSYVKINGKNYHIDPTFGLSGGNRLAYFMMDDQQREYTGFPKKDFVITSCYAQLHETPEFTADDNTFSKLWETDCDAIDRVQKRLTLHNDLEEENAKPFQFSYKGY